jgi:spermidine/putrescine transport system substrate-binding protein
MPDKSPERALEEFLAAQRLSRRGFIGRTGSAALALSGLSTVIAACGGVEGTEEAAKERAKDTAAANHPKVPLDNLTVSNWPLYVDKKVLKAFEKEFSVDLKYTEDINDNDEFYGKVRQQLEREQSIDRDIVVLTDPMAAKWVKNAYVEPIDKRNVPNISNLVDNLATINYDPEREFTLPWQSGATIIGYNPKKTGRKLTSVNDFFDPEFKGRVTMIDYAYDAASLIAIGDGQRSDEATLDQLLAAIDKIDKANQSGQIRRFTGNDYVTDLTKGNAWVCMAYSGDLVQLKADNPDLEFLFPEEGAVLWTDNMMMPAKAEHYYAAEVFMNYVYDPEVAAKIAAYVNYIPPVKGVREVLEASDPKIVENPLIFPDEELSSKLYPYPSLSAADERTMNEAWAKVTGA